MAFTPLIEVGSRTRRTIDVTQDSGWSQYVFVNSKTFQPMTKKASTTALQKAGINDFHFHDLRFHLPNGSLDFVPLG